MNTRILISRNKREGAYAGKMFSFDRLGKAMCRTHRRSGSDDWRASLREIARSLRPF